jgi:hypothetical protein
LVHLCASDDRDFRAGVHRWQSTMTAEILEVFGLGWGFLAAGFWGGYLYLRMRTFVDNVF